MASGIWTSVSGAAAQSQAVDTVANNLANAETQGFKKDLPTFKEYLSTAERIPSNTGIPYGPIKNRDLYPLDGRDQAFVTVTGTVSDFKQGSIKVTHAPLDLALDGTGFLEVSTPNGIRYTRHGSLKVATDGRLVTNDGFPVLSQASAAPEGRTLASVGEDPSAAARYINLANRGSNFSVSEEGELFAGADLVAKISVAEFANPKMLTKTGAQYFENKDPANRVLGGPAKTSVRQGMIESSNVNPIEEMSNLIKANRLFEHDMKALKVYGDMMQKEANEIGKL